MKWQVDQMTSWWNDKVYKMTSWWNDKGYKMTTLMWYIDQMTRQNDKLMKGQLQEAPICEKVDVITIWWNNKLMKWQVDKTVSWWNDKLIKLQCW